MVPAERIHDDLTVLRDMIEEDFPVRVSSRFLKTTEVVYGFEDAPGRGLGSMMESVDRKGIDIRIGTCSTKEEEDESSNWREFTNVAETIEEETER